jgi:5-methyltetrahydrofolate--homocysteine methyltransferase
LAEGGADVLWIETMSSEEELRAAIKGAERAGLSYVCTLSFDTNGCTMMGVRPTRVARMMHELDPGPMAFGGNCGTGASELMAALLNMTEAAEPGDVLVAKSNCGIPEYVDGQIQYSGTPELMADYARLCRDAGVRVIGGCCGTTPAHVAAMHTALMAHEPGARPALEAVVARLGQVSAGAQKQLAAEDDAGESAADARSGRRRGRRRR